MSDSTTRDKVIRAEINFTNLETRFDDLERRTDTLINQQQEISKTLLLLQNDVKWAHRIATGVGTLIGATAWPVWEYLRPLIHPVNTANKP